MFDKQLFSLFIFLVSLSVKAQNSGNFPMLKFDIDTVDFGTVNEGDTVRYDFWFTNTGTVDLEIKQAYPPCGCTYPTFTPGIIKPGERGKIHVEFYSTGWGGHNVVKEVIIILVNGHDNFYARFKAKVVNKAFQNELDQYKKESAAAETKKESRKNKRRKNRKSPSGTPNF